VQATKIVSLLETYITKELFYCGGKYRRSTGKEIVKVGVNTGQKKKPKSSEPCRCVYACMHRVCIAEMTLYRT